MPVKPIGLPNILYNIRCSGTGRPLIPALHPCLLPTINKLGCIIPISQVPMVEINARVVDTCACLHEAVGVVPVQ